MELPQPEADELGRPILSVTSTDISRAYRRISVLVHPDKNPGEDARKAFEALNEAHRKLKDPGQLVSTQADHSSCHPCYPCLPGGYHDREAGEMPDIMCTNCAS